jgi:hypothetical protein
VFHKFKLTERKMSRWLGWRSSLDPTQLDKPRKGYSWNTRPMFLREVPTLPSEDAGNPRWVPLMIIIGRQPTACSRAADYLIR